jgi:hypothetical protein
MTFFQNTQNRFGILIVVFIFVFLFVGCVKNKAPSDMPSLQPCTIIVTIDGKPLANASVHCQPNDNGKWYGSGITDNNGVAKILTLSRYSGLTTGDYVVSVVKKIPDPNWTPKPEEGHPNISVIDEKFGDETTSPLKCTVTTGKNQFQLEVTTP